MASKKKTHLDPNQIIESSPHFLQYMIQLVEHMLQDSEILKRTDCKNIRSYRHLKSSLQRLLNLLYKAESVSLITCSDTERYLAQLKSLQAEFFAIGGDTSGVCAEAISILDVLKAYVVSKKDGTKPGTAQRKLIETSADEKYKQFHDFSHAQFPQSELLAYPLGGGHSKIPNDDQNNDASINPTGNEPLAENLAKSDQPPDDGDVPPSGEAAIQESNNSPVNPPHYQGVLDGFASGGNTRFTSLQLSPYLYGEGTKEQLLPVKQQCNFEETVADPVVDPVEAIDHPTAQNSAQLCSQTNSNGGLATCEIVSPTTTTYTTTITVHAKDSIKDVKKETELDSFTSECGGLAEARRKSPVPIGPLHSPVGTITVCPIPVSGGPQNVVTASTQQAATVWNYEELSLDPRNTSGVLSDDLVTFVLTARMSITEASNIEDTVKDAVCKSKNVNERERVPFTEKKSIDVTYSNDIISYSSSPDLDPNYTTLKVVSHTITKGTPVNNYDGLPLVENQSVCRRTYGDHHHVKSSSMGTSSDENNGTDMKDFSMETYSDESNDIGAKVSTSMGTTSNESNGTGMKRYSMKTFSDESNDTGAKGSSIQMSSDENNDAGVKGSTSMETSSDKCSDTSVKSSFSMQTSSDESSDAGAKGSSMQTSSDDGSDTGAKSSSSMQTSSDESSDTGAKCSSMQTSSDESSDTGAKSSSSMQTSSDESSDTGAKSSSSMQISSDESSDTGANSSSFMETSSDESSDTGAKSSSSMQTSSAESNDTGEKGSTCMQTSSDESSDTGGKCFSFMQTSSDDTGMKGSTSMGTSSDESNGTGMKGFSMQTSSDESNNTCAKGSTSLQTSSDESSNTGGKCSSFMQTSSDENSAKSSSMEWPPPALHTKKIPKTKHIRSLKTPFLSRNFPAKHVPANETMDKSVEWPPPMNSNSTLPKKLLPSYSEATTRKSCKLKAPKKVPKNTTGKGRAGKGITLSVKWLSCTSRGVFTDGKPLTSSHSPRQNLKGDIQQLPPKSRPKRKNSLGGKQQFKRRKSSLSNKQRFKLWKDIIKWKDIASCRKRPLPLKYKKSKPPFKKRKKRSLSFLAYKQPSHRAHTTTRPPHYGSTVTIAGQANSCSDSAQDSGSKSDSDDEDSDSQESNDENTSDHHSGGQSAAASSGGDDDGNNNRDDNNRCPSGGSGGDGGGNGDDDDDDDDGNDKDDDDGKAEKDNETSSDGDDSVIPICACDLCSDSASVVVTSLPSSVNASLHPTALNTVFTEEDLRRTFRPIMVVPLHLVMDSPVMTNYVRCGEMSSMVTGTQQVMCTPSQPCHQGCRGESAVSEIIFNQNLPGDNCSSTLPQDLNSSGGGQYIEQFYVEDGPLQEQESVEALQGLTYWDRWSSQI